jgi:sec-independent protein translocase protein TatB
MFDIGWSELLVIAAVALIVIGPKELPGVLRSVGHWMGKIRRMASDFQSQFNEAMREAEMSDLKKHADDLNQNVKSLTSGLDPYGIARDVEASITGTPEAPATPAADSATAPSSTAPPSADLPPPAEPAPATPTPVADAPTTAPDAQPSVKGAA